MNGNKIRSAVSFMGLLLVIAGLTACGAEQVSTSDPGTTTVTAISLATTVSQPTTPSIQDDATYTPTPYITPGDGSATPTPDRGCECPSILHFSAVSDIERPGPGDTVQLSWEVERGTANICISYGGWTNSQCFDVDPKGQQTVTLRTEDPVADHWVDFTLNVRDEINTNEQKVRLKLRCHYSWFEDELSGWCPDGPVSEYDTVAQTYEHGLAISQGNNSTLFFDEPGDPCRAYFIQPGTDLEIDLPEPPAGRVSPEAAAAVLWSGRFSGTEDLQTRLGWPVSEPYSYRASQQCELTPVGRGRCLATMPDGGIYTAPGELIGIPFDGELPVSDSYCLRSDAPVALEVDSQPLVGDGQCEPMFIFNWARHKLEGLSAIVQAKIDEVHIPGTQVFANAYGEDMIEYDESSGETEVCGFVIMETDFHLNIPVEDLSNQDALGNLLLKAILVLMEFPPDETPGPQPGIVSVNFHSGDESLWLQFTVLEMVKAIEDGKEGADLIAALRNREALPE